MREPKQGVAQRVIRSLDDRCHEANLTIQQEIHRTAKRGGAKELHTELSREARMILAECITEDLPDGKDVEYVWLEDAFARLGLDLTDPDTDRSDEGAPPRPSEPGRHCMG